MLALTGQVQTQVIGPGTFQELPLEKAFDAVAEWGQTILSPANATEIAALAMKHAIVQRDVAHLVLPDNVQELPGLDDPPPRLRAGRMAATTIAPPADELARAIELLRAAGPPTSSVRRWQRRWPPRIDRAWSASRHPTATYDRPRAADHDTPARPVTP